MILVTGATGQLGRLVIEQLLKTVAPESIVAGVRSPEKAADLAAQGIQVRALDYTNPASILTALKGVEKVLLISSSEVGQRFPQHKNVIDVAKAEGVSLLAYTSILNATESKLGLAAEHVETEAALAESGVPHVLLRNGWYTENYLASIPPALEFGAFIGSAKEGRIASAGRIDYAAAAATVLTSEGHAGKVYELAGDESYTLTELVAELNKQTGKSVVYQDMPQADFAAALKGAGLPDGLAELLADSDAAAAEGGLFDNSKTLSQLIGRPTTSLANLMADALKA